MQRNPRDNPIFKIKYCFHFHFFKASPGRKQAKHRAQQFPEARQEVQQSLEKSKKKPYQKIPRKSTD